MKCLSAFEIDLNACDECPASLQGDGVRENKLQRHFEAFHCMGKRDVLPSAASRVAPMGFHYSSCWVSGTLARLLWRSHPACKLTLRQRLKTSLLPLGKYLPYSVTCKDCFFKTALSPLGKYLPYSVTCKDCFLKTALSPLGKYLPYSVTCKDCFLKTSLSPLGKYLPYSVTCRDCFLKTSLPPPWERAFGVASADTWIACFLYISSAHIREVSMHKVAVGNETLKVA
jgi:hypothetical protein